jgi:hypothetical protein
MREDRTFLLWRKPDICTLRRHPPPTATGSPPRSGHRLPTGWSYRARTLDAPLVVTTRGEATVVQDELQNTYSRYVTGG